MNKPNRKFTPKPTGGEQSERPRRPRTNEGGRAAGFSDKRYSPMLDPDDNKEWQQRDKAGRSYRPGDEERSERGSRSGDGPRGDGPRSGEARTGAPRFNSRREDGPRSGTRRGDAPRGDAPRGNDFNRNNRSDERSGSRFNRSSDSRFSSGENRRDGNRSEGNNRFGEERSSPRPRRNEEGGFSRPGSFRSSEEKPQWGNKPRPRFQDDENPRPRPARGDWNRSEDSRPNNRRENTPRNSEYRSSRSDSPRPERNSGRRGESRFDTHSTTPRGENRFNSPRTGGNRGKSSFDDDRRSRSIDQAGAGFEGRERTPFAKKEFSERKNISTTTPPTYDFSKIRNKEPKAAHTDANIRLNKYIADAGICSRRDADTLIAGGQIKVNNEVITQMGYKVSPADTVTYNGKKIRPEKLVYVLLNKPKDFITTTDDPQERKTVMELVSGAAEQRIYPVGRLDRNTTGLLLLTNDGELAEKLSHPSHKVKKVYQVLLDKPLTDEDYERIQTGIQLEDGPAPVDDIGFVTPDKTVIGVEIHIGRNRIVRRIFESLGYEVLGLDRVIYAGLTKKDLPRGHWRYLLQKEVIRLKHFS